MTFQLANASRITDRLWTGGDLEVGETRVASVQLGELVGAGLTHILDVRKEWEDASFITGAAPNVCYHWAGIPDAGQVVADEWWNDQTRRIRRALQEPKARVLVHCHMGINRGPSLTFATLLTLGWDPVAALEAIRRARPIAYMRYAEGALDWWLRTTGMSERERADALARTEAWRTANPLRLGQAIRQGRAVR